MYFKSSTSLVWLIMASFCGLVGFVIVYHYVSNERHIQRFAILIDAGSTQTRSSLFAIDIDAPEVMRLTSNEGGAIAADASEKEEETSPPPLSKLIQVRQVSSCVNGGPVAQLQSPTAAHRLLNKCLIKFSDQIKRLDFNPRTGRDDPDKEAATADNSLGAQQPIVGARSSHTSGQDSDLLPEARELTDQLARFSGRVDSITHVYLGATAGMRALRQLNESRASEKVAWLEEGLNATTMGVAETSNGPEEGGLSGPFLNKGFVGIIEGTDEAAFGWLSVNFVSENLLAQRPLADNQSFQLDSMKTPQQQANSVGTLELGGASAQMAFQVDEQAAALQSEKEQQQEVGLSERHLELFNERHRLATRSDLCLGMSQAILRANFILLREFHRVHAGTIQMEYNSMISLENPCLQKGATVKLAGSQLVGQWHGACLNGTDHSEESQEDSDEKFRRLMFGKSEINFFGTGQVAACDSLLENLLEPNKCARYFSLCPRTRNEHPPPSQMPFVTISGYNHALVPLDLQAQQASGQGSVLELEQMIESKLGGKSVNYTQFIERTNEFCSTNARDLSAKFPKGNKAYQLRVCLQLVYIKKLLTQFYKFDPLTNWHQIKFLLFAPAPNGAINAATAAAAAASERVGGSRGAREQRRDIDWTLGMLLNATSGQLDLQSRGELDASSLVLFHHGASVAFVLRAIFLLMLACCLLAICLLVTGIVEAKKAIENSTNSCSSSNSSYDVIGGTNNRNSYRVEVA